MILYTTRDQTRRPLSLLSMTSLSSILENHLKPQALAHWTRPGVESLSEALYLEDPMGLRGSGLPGDEYQGEAELAFALALGCDTVEDLWKVGPKSLQEVCEISEDTLMEHLLKSFRHMFSQDVPVHQTMSLCFKKALIECTWGDNLTSQAIGASAEPNVYVSPPVPFESSLRGE